MKSTKSIVAASCSLCLATATHAFTYHDVAGYEDGVGTGVFAFNAGAKYLLSVQSQYPLQRADFANSIEVHVESYFPDGRENYGEEVVSSTDIDLSSPSPVDYYQTTLLVPRLPSDVIEYYPDGAVFQSFSYTQELQVLSFYGAFNQSTNPSAQLGNFTLNIEAVPEPTTWTLTALGLFALGFKLRSRRIKAATA